MNKIIDVTIEIKEGMILWEGDGGVRIQQVMTLAKGDPYNLTRLQMSVHQGTHIDAPLHFLEHGGSTDQFSLSSMIGPAQVVQINHEVDFIDQSALEQCGIHSDTRRLLIKTRNSEFWKNRDKTFRRDFCGVNTDGARYLSKLGLELVGIDYLSISPLSDLEEPHRILMNKGIVILETLNLGEVEPGFYNLYCLPLKLVGTEGSPARVILTD